MSNERRKHSSQSGRKRKILRKGAVRYHDASGMVAGGLAGHADINESISYRYRSTKLSGFKSSVFRPVKLFFLSAFFFLFFMGISLFVMASLWYSPIGPQLRAQYETAWFVLLDEVKKQQQTEQ